MVCCNQQKRSLDTSSPWSAFFGSAHAFVFTLLFSSFTFLSFTLPVPQGTRKAMTHLHGSSLFLLSAAALWAGMRLNALRYALGMPMILILRPSSARLLLRSPSTPPTVCMFCRSAWRCEFAESRLIQPTYSTKRQGFLIAGDLAVL